MIKKILTIALIIIIAQRLYPQVNANSISFNLRYPLPIGDNFINKGLFGDGYFGLVDLGIDYNILKVKRFGLGVSFNSSLLKTSSFLNTTLLTLNPKIKIDYNINKDKFSIIPQVGFGYSNLRFYSIVQATNDYGEPIGTISEKTASDALTFLASTKFLFNSDKSINWYLLLSYEFVKLEKPEIEGGNTKFNRNIQLIYPGIGILWRFKEN